MKQQQQASKRLEPTPARRGHLSEAGTSQLKGSPFKPTSLGTGRQPDQHLALRIDRPALNARTGLFLIFFTSALKEALMLADDRRGGGGGV